MCLLFFESKETSEPDEYKLVLANVRDEFYTRPTSYANFWSDHPSVIGGRDLQPGREGGTWLAMNKDTGKIGVLLNVLQPDYELGHNKLGRGFIVNDFVTQNISYKSYLDHLSQNAENYNGFLFIAIELRRHGLEAGYFSTHFRGQPKEIPYGVHGFGNSLDILNPWPKVSHGRKRFESLLSGHRTTDTKDQLVQDIFGMLSDRTLKGLDRQMLRQGDGRKLENLEKLSSVFVSIPETKYGSRTHTIILVDGLGNVDYIERTMKDPIECDPEIGVTSPWLLTEHRFSLQS